MGNNAPTFAQTMRFYQLVEEGRITAENFQNYLENPNRFIDDGRIFPVSIDYSMSVHDMIKAGKYDEAHSDWSSFSVSGNGKMEAKLRLIPYPDEHLDDVQAVCNHINRLGLEPARVEHLLAFGARYPNKQRDFPIFAPGSIQPPSYADNVSAVGVPYLFTRHVKRIVGVFTYRLDDKWHTRWRFLAVCK